MIIQTAPAGEPRLAIMMYEHTALSHQFARAFGNEAFQPADPNDVMFHVTLHHDAGWAEFDRDPPTDPATGLPYNLIDTPIRFITVTSARSPDYNERHHPYCGLLSSMHSWGLYNGRYGLSDMVLINRFSEHERPIVQQMLDGELARQARLKKELEQDPRSAAWLDHRHIFQNYKQLQFFDLLALYFNRIHPSERGEASFDHVPRTAEVDAAVTIRPRGTGTYELSPWPFGGRSAEFAYAGRRIRPGQQTDAGGWRRTLAATPTVWENVTLVAT